MQVTPLKIVNDNVIIPNPLNKNSTGPISIGSASQGTIKVDIYLSLDIFIKGYTTEKPIIPEPEPKYTPVFLSKEEDSTPDTYELNWYTYGEDPKPDTYKLN